MVVALKYVSLSFISLILAVVASFAVSTISVNAQDQPQQEPAPVSAEAQPESDDQANDFTFTAQDGDSYTKMTRKAVQIFGIEESKNLSSAQIIFVETNLAQLAGSPELNLGEEVTIDRGVVSDWVTKAEQLTDEEKTAWEVYVPSVDFNTNSVGEAS
jgi:hypothetical protein